MPAITIPAFLFNDIVNGNVGREELLEVRMPVINLNLIEKYSHYDLSKLTGSVELPGRAQLLRIRTEESGTHLPPPALSRMHYKGTEEEFEAYYEGEYKGWKSRFIVLFEFRPITELYNNELTENK